jgi:hypothetical protein
MGPKRLLGLCLSCGDHREGECVINQTLLAFDSSLDGMRGSGVRGVRDQVRAGRGVDWPMCRLGGGWNFRFR